MLKMHWHQSTMHDVNIWEKEKYNDGASWIVINGAGWAPEQPDSRLGQLTNRYRLVSGRCLIDMDQRAFYTPAQRSWRGGGVYTGFTLSVCPSVRPSVCRRHGFRSISQVCFGISISNFICMLMVAIGRSLLIFSDVTFKMATWRPYWIFWFLDSNFTLALNINCKLKWHNTHIYG